MVRVAIKCICNWTSVNCLSLRVYADFIVSSKINFVSFDIVAHIMVPSVFLCMSFLWPVDLMDFWKCSCVTNMMSIDECAPEDCSWPTIVRLSSVGMARCSLIALKVPLIQPVSLVIRRRPSLQCSPTSCLELSADGPPTAGLVIEPFQTVAARRCYLVSGTKVQWNHLPPI